MRSLLLCAVASLSLASTLPAQTPGLIFHVPFEGTADAQHAAGRAQPISAQGLTYAPGATGQAVAISANSLLEYASAGNIAKEHGTITLWFKPNWRASDMDSGDSKDWHCIFWERVPDKQERIGSGALWFWFWGQSFRGDLSDKADSYRLAGTPGLDQTNWAHLAFTWDVNRGSQLFMNGVVVGTVSDGTSPLKIIKGDRFTEIANRFESFCVGSQGNSARADGLIDDFKVFDRVLAPSEIAAEMAAISPVRLDVRSAYLVEQPQAAGQSEIAWALTNVSGAAVSASCSWSIKGADGQTLAEGKVAEGTIPAGGRRDMSAAVPALARGQYKLIVQPAVGPQKSADISVLGRGNAYLKSAGQLETSPVESIDFVKGVPAERFVVRGESRTAKLGDRTYYEAGPKKNDRFALHVTLPEADVPYLVEWDYPDDKLRTMEMLFQEAKNSGGDYALQTGILCGDEFPNSMQTLTHRSILWPRSTDLAVIFMTARVDAPVAVSALRISKVVGGLPDANLKPAAPVSGWRRTVGIHFEDPAIGYDFGVKGQLMPQYEQTLDRLVAYMKWSGQNLLSYPVVWYHGRIDSGYQPRIHESDFIACILAKFAQHDLSFMPAINLQNIKLPEGVEINEQTVADGSLHASPVMILRDGKPNPGGWHGTPPNFNPLHPAVRKYVDDQVDDLLLRYGDSPAFKGITLHLTKHTIPWFGTIEAGYNDYCIETFEKDSGIKVAVDRADPLRGKLYHDWLMANAREQWVQWRCRQIADWYKSMADRISQRRPDLRLNILSYNPTVTDFGGDPRQGSPGYALAINRESGLDPALYESAGNIIMAQTIYPSDFRWKGDNTPKDRETLMVDHMKEGTYALIDNVLSPWVNMHDRYFEDGIGGATWWGKTDPLKADWLKEMGWRVSVLNPSRHYFLEHYVLPLRYGDVLGFTKGGFLIGTNGVEDYLREFSRAFMALPAEKFADLPGSTELVKARSLSNAAGNWLYVVNTGRDAVDLTIDFGAGSKVIDLSTGREQTTAGPTAKLHLKPYELRSFQCGAAPAGVTVSQ